MYTFLSKFHTSFFLHLPLEILSCRIKAIQTETMLDSQFSKSQPKKIKSNWNSQSTCNRSQPIKANRPRGRFWLTDACNHLLEQENEQTLRYGFTSGGNVIYWNLWRWRLFKEILNKHDTNYSSTTSCVKI